MKFFGKNLEKNLVLRNYGLILFLALTVGSISEAQNKCTELFVENGQHRHELVLEIRKNEQIKQNFFNKLFVKPSEPIPLFMKPTRTGEIPVILANAQTYAGMKSIYAKSLGIIVQHQPDYKNDHGMFRIGENLIDMDSPGYRARGELNKTGLAWVDVKSYLDYSAFRQGYKRIEVLFQLSPKDYQLAESYQLVRRAAIIRAPFSFNGARTNMNQMNMLRQGGEHCFIFCSGSALGSQIHEIERHLQEAGFDQFKTELQNPEFTRYFSQLEKLLSEAQMNDLVALNPNISLKAALPQSLKNSVAFNSLDKNRQHEILNWYVGYHYSARYQQLLTYLGVRGGAGFESYQSPRASAVLVYDSTATQAQFLSKDYSSRGVFSTWTHND